MPLLTTRRRVALAALAAVALTALALVLPSARADDPDGSAAALAWLAARQDAAGASGLVRSFAIPADDPDAGLAPLSFTYDDGLVAIAFTAGGEYTRAARVLEGLEALQAADGSLPFAYDTAAGVVASPLRRSGAIAWAGYAAVRYDTTYAAPGPFAGYKPYLPDPGVEGAPHVVWSEGTWGALLLLLLLRARLGQDVSADVASMVALQAVDPGGGYLQVTQGRRSPPGEYQVWPSVAGTAWVVIVLCDEGGLWAPS